MDTETKIMKGLFKVVFFLPALALAMCVTPIFFTRTWFGWRGE